jgi:hypothetical protein
MLQGLFSSGIAGGSVEVEVRVDPEPFEVAAAGLTLPTAKINVAASRVESPAGPKTGFFIHDLLVGVYEYS